MKAEAACSRKKIGAVISYQVARVLGTRPISSSCPHGFRSWREIGGSTPGRFTETNPKKTNFGKALRSVSGSRPAHAGAGRMSHPKFVASARESTGLWTVISQFDDRSCAIAVLFLSSSRDFGPSATRGGLFLAQAPRTCTVKFLSDIRSEGIRGI